MSELVERALNGDRRALARLVSLVETGGPQARQAMTELFPHSGRAHIVGVTGAPGAGKSSLVNGLAKVFRQSGRTVGIIAVDPTSPFTGGAILGDRIRMQDLSGDPGVFIRSMATRGSLGGLAWATRDAIKVLDAAGYQIVVVETVGAGQSEVDIAAAADSTVVVIVPGLGDDVQAIKAGILEIADVFAVNKADLPGVDQAVASLRMMLNLGAGQGRRVWHHETLTDVPDDEPQAGRDWTPPICRTVAVRGEGISELADAIDQHRAYLTRTGLKEVHERARVRADFLDLLRHELLEQLLACVAPEYVESLIDRVLSRELDPYTAASQVLAERQVTK